MEWRQSKAYVGDVRYASTTGNITGVYDTSGGATEYMAAVMKEADGTNLFVSRSEFDQTELNQIGTEGKYLDVYEYGTEETDYSRGYLGDATIEMGPFQNYRGAWYNDYARFISQYQWDSWFARGVTIVDQEIAGIAAFHAVVGWPATNRTYRIVMI